MDYLIFYHTFKIMEVFVLCEMDESVRSACFMALGDYPGALRDAEACRRLQPQWAKACYRLAVARLALKQFEDAAVS